MSDILKLICYRNQIFTEIQKSVYIVIMWSCQDSSHFSLGLLLCKKFDLKTGILFKNNFIKNSFIHGIQCWNVLSCTISVIQYSAISERWDFFNVLFRLHSLTFVTASTTEIYFILKFAWSEKYDSRAVKLHLNNGLDIRVSLL